VSLRFLADQCVPGGVIDALTAVGYEVIRLRAILPIDAPDPVVIAAAQKQGALLLSLNGDFADIVTYPPADYGGIIGLQVRNHPEVLPQIIDRLTAYLAGHSARDHYRGRLLLVEPHRIRIRS